MAPKLPPKKAIREALTAAKGNKKMAAEMLGCSRTALHYHIVANPDLQTVVDECRAGRLDIAEDILYSAVLRGEFPAVRFFLMTQGKDRGYTERQEVTGAEGGNIVIRFVDPEDHA